MDAKTLKQEIEDRLIHFYGKTDGTYEFPNSVEGDLLKMIQNFISLRGPEPNHNTDHRWEVIVTDRRSISDTHIGRFGLNTQKDLNDIMTHLHVSTSDVKRLVTDWLLSAGWGPDTTSSNFIQLQTAVIAAISPLVTDTSQHLADHIEKLTKHKDTLNYGSRILNTAGVKTKFKDLFDSDNMLISNDDVFNSLYDITISGVTAIGRGEVLITLLSEGCSASDIRLPTGDQIEVKAGTGRVGTEETGKISKLALDKFADAIPRMVIAERERIAGRVLIVLRDLHTYFKQTIPSMYDSMNKKWREPPIVNRVFSQISDATSEETNIGVSVKDLTSIQKLRSISDTPHLYDSIQRVKKDVARFDKLSCEIKHGSHINFKTVVSHLLHHKQEMLQSGVKFIIDHSKRPISVKSALRIEDEYIKAKTVDEVSTIIASIQMVDYSRDKNFSILQFINDDKDQLSIKFNGCADSDLETCLNLRHHFTAKPSGFTMLRGFSVTLK